MEATSMPDVQVAYALEGHRDFQVVPVIVGRVCETAAPSLRLVSAPWRGRKRGFGFVSELPETIRRGHEGGADLLVCVVDANGTRQGQRLAEMREAAQKVQPCPLRVVPGVAVRALEAWLLADEEAISQALAGHPHVPRQPDPRSLAEPKQTLEELIEDVTSGDEFYTDAIGVRIAEGMSLRRVRDRCPDLDDFATALSHALRDLAAIPVIPSPSEPGTGA
jgi:hypothetical protein